MQTPDLRVLLELCDEIPAFRALRDRLRAGQAGQRLGVLEAARPFLVAALHRGLHRPLLVVTPRSEDARRFYEQLLGWCGEGGVWLYPEPDTLPYERVAVDGPGEVERLRVLAALAGRVGGDAPPLVVASAAALLSRTAPRDRFAGSFHTVRVGSRADPLRLLRRWQRLGYRIEPTVEVPGSAGRRGGILDVYPPTADRPLRLEFFGDTVESIRCFDPATQRSEQAVDSATIGPATELLVPLLLEPAELEAVLGSLDLAGCNPGCREQFEQDLALLRGRQLPAAAHLYAPLFPQDSLFDYLPGGTLLVIDDRRRLGAAVAELEDRLAELRASREERGELPPGFPCPYLTRDEFHREVEGRQPLELVAWEQPGEDDSGRLDFAAAMTCAGRLPAFVARMKQVVARGERAIIVTLQADRLSELLAEADIIAAPLRRLRRVPPKGSVTLVHGLLEGGWVLGGTTHLLTDAEVFGITKHRPRLRRQPVPHRRLALDIRPGDYVVHVEHGIAEFVGFQKMAPDGHGGAAGGDGQKEFLVLRYAAGDRLYVPVDQMDRVTRYVGAQGERPPVLSRLGTQEWHRTKQKVRESVEALAEDLLNLYAARQVVPGHAFSPDSVWQHEMEASFPYVETPDQIEVQRHVKADMERPRPMDRLVCGDVGYGKTEVAVRAAFKAVMDGKQVAVLVPTTVLAQQHYYTFRERLAAFPVVVEMLSRFRSEREQAAILAGLASGRVDICIGTHRLLQKDVRFKDLGLLIIDEEQRFGVAHKEYLKQMRREVDVLTLSATPIPRTLHMALTGVRDMSTMETPPEERLPVKTYVAEYDDRLVREAIIREMERNGQVFFVHNRVQSIPLVAARLAAIVPEARIGIAHGQMPEEELERVTADFIRGRYDVLLCTTIIESGLDMPNVNTLIVNRADRFGLTQLYQLRGRVGRGARLAYAYFLYDRGQRLSRVAEQRLRTIYEATELGAGFGIAMRDLEIRGAGTLLGTRQSGHISAVGFNLYTQLLAAAVEKLKARAAGRPEPARRPDLPLPIVDLRLRAHIPEHYVADQATRLELYQQMASFDRPEQVEQMAAGLRDRFGPVPAAVEELLFGLRVKVLAARAGVESVTLEGGEVVLRLADGLRFDGRRLAPALGPGVKLGRTQLRLSRRQLGRGWRRVLEEVLRLSELA